MKPVHAVLIASTLTLCAAFALASPPPELPGRAAEKRAFMAPIYESLRVLLPLTVPHTQLAALEHRPAIERALNNLAASGEALARHVQTDEPGNRLLAQSVEHEARALMHTWRRGRFAETAFGLQEMTRLCVACHSKLPSDSSPISQGFLDDRRLTTLPADERGELLLATRRFDEALTSYESWFSDPSVPATRMLAPLTDYLVTAVRVKGDYQRASAELARLATRKDVWSNLREDLAAWQQDLGRLARRPSQPTLAAARALVEEAEARSRYPADRRPLVRWIAASSALYRLLERGGLDDAQAAETYLLLTLAEARIERDFFLSGIESYLASCVRLVPHTELAERCFALLEEQTVLAFAGTGAGPLPEDIERRLRALEALATPRQGRER